MFTLVVTRGIINLQFEITVSMERTPVSFGPGVFFLRKAVIWMIKCLKHMMS